MKVFVYNYRDDEKEFFEKYESFFGLEIKQAGGVVPTIDNCYLAEGCECINITTHSKITAEMIQEFYRLGVRFISTRTIGYEHIDLEAAKAAGIQVANVSYSPSSVADYAIMMMLMVLRKAKCIIYRSLGQDYDLTEIRGRELPYMTVGIIGTGKIGQTVAKHLSGFGCKIYAYDKYPTDKLDGIVEYVDLDTLYANSDIITLHVPGTAENEYMINRESIAKMKDNAILINTARGSLVDSDALIEALENGKLFGAGLDLIDNDRLIYYRDQKYKTLKHRQMAVLNSMPNVLVMPHMAFYTDKAVEDMVYNSLESCMLFAKGEENPWLVQ